MHAGRAAGAVRPVGPEAVAGRLRAVPVAPAPVTLRVEVRPPWPFRLRGASPDGIFRRRGDGVQRLVFGVHAGAVQAAPDRVIFGARAPTREAAELAIARLRFATGVDEDHREFYETFRDDELIGRAVRTDPHLRVRRRTCPWEAFMWAVTEQLIAYEDAVLIQRRLIRALGTRCTGTGLVEAPSAAVIAQQSVARLQSFGLTETRAIALRRAAVEVTAGRVDLRSHDDRRLLAIPGIGPWTIEILALHGQGRYDLVPAGDLGFIKAVGRILTGNPRARAEVPEVYAFFERFGKWKGLAGEYVLRSSGA